MIHVEVVRRTLKIKEFRLIRLDFEDSSVTFVIPCRLVLF